MFAFVMVLILGIHEDIKRDVIFSMQGLFFSKSLSIFTKMGFSSGHLETKSQWSMNFLSEVDRHSRLSFVCLPPYLFLSFTTEDFTEGQTHAGQVLYHWTTPPSLFPLSVMETGSHWLAQTGLDNTWWHKPASDLRASSAARASLHCRAWLTESWLWGTNRREMLLLTACDTWRTCVQGGVAPKIRWRNDSVCGKTSPLPSNTATELFLVFSNVIFLLCVFCVYFYYCSTTIWQITYLIRASEMKRCTAIFTGSVWGEALRMWWNTITNQVDEVSITRSLHPSHSY